MTMPWPAEQTSRPTVLPLPGLRPQAAGPSEDCSPRPPAPARRMPGRARPWPEALQRVPRSRGRHLRALVGCDTVVAQLPLVVDGSRRPTPAVAEHLRSCPACQAEQASYGRLLRALRSLRDEVGSPAPPALAGTLGALQGRPSAAAWGCRRAPGPWALGAAGMVALSAGIVLVWAARRPRALAG